MKPHTPLHTPLLVPQSVSQKLYPAAEVRDNEAAAAAASGIALYELMERAGASVYALARQAYPDAQSWLVIAGPGNNGGDAFVVARLAKLNGIDVKVLEIPSQSQKSDDAQQAKQSYLEVKGEVALWQHQVLPSCDLLIDGLLGTGLTAPVREDYHALINSINQHPCPVVSIDLPSGLHADTGAILGAAVSPQHTLTFIGIKSGLMTAQGRQQRGQLHFDPLGVEAAFNQQAKASAYIARLAQAGNVPPRALNSHKGQYGKVLCIGGNVSMSGAIRLTSSTALRCGAGLVSVYCHPQSQAIVAGHCPEVMVESRQEQLQSLLDWCSCVAIGPGLGKDQWGHNTMQLVSKYLQANNKAVVLDADALNWLAQHPQSWPPLENLLLTPHPTEAARLLHSTTADVEADRFAAANQLQQQFGAHVLLKGAGTVINTSEQQWVCDHGNPGMATAGMGDVLTGVLAALLAQGVNVDQSAVLGACLHSAAADICAERHGQRGLLASDLLPILRQLLNE